MQKRVLLAVTLFLFCVGSFGVASAKPDFSGVWDTTFGQVNLTQTGVTVVGSYLTKKGNAGKLEGVVAGNRLNFFWSQQPTYKVPQDAGDGYFKLSSSGDKISGKYRHGYEGEWYADWNGTRSVSNFSGSWSTNFGILVLKQTGPIVTGSYLTKGGKAGKIAGTVTGNNLKHTWSQEPSYAPPNDAGDGYFVISGNGKSLNGKYRYGYSGPWYGDWNGTKK